MVDICTSLVTKCYSLQHEGLRFTAHTLRDVRMSLEFPDHENGRLWTPQL